MTRFLRKGLVTQMIAITPYEAVGGIRFGMSQDEVMSTLGSPKAATKDRRGNIVLRYIGQNADCA